MIKPENNEINEIFDKESNLVWKKEFYFIIGADTQFGQFERLGIVNRDSLDGKQPWYKEIELAEAAVEKINQLQPKPMFMVICGDMLDQFSYKLVPNIVCRIFTNKPDPIRDEQYKDFVKVFSKLNIPLICVCGNHDVGDTPNQNLVTKYRSEFGSEYFKFYFNGVLFISLNSNYYFDDTDCKDLTKQQDEWLDNVLETESSQFKHIVVFMHIPLFIKNYDESSTISNIPREQRKILISKFLNAGVKKVFAGHIHRNEIATFKDLECVSTSAIGLQIGGKGSGFRIVKVKENKIKHKYYKLREVPKKIDF